MNDKTILGYAEYGVELGLLLGPDAVGTARVGEAFGRVFDSGGSAALFRELYDPDGSHPAPAGTYLAALCIYAAVTGASPEGVAYCPRELDPAVCKSLRQFAVPVAREARRQRDD